MPIDLINRARQHGERVAIVETGVEFTYGDLLDASENVARTLLADRDDLGEARIAFMVAPGFEYVATQWGIWRAGGIAVPLALSHPAPELEYVLDDTGAEAVVSDKANELKLRPLATARDVWFVGSGEAAEGDSHRAEGNELPQLDESRRAMILYTSGTTSRPKGVVTTH